MADDSSLPDLAELALLGLCDPDAPDAGSRVELIRLVLTLGATTDEIASSPNLGELALDLRLRPRGPMTLDQAIAEAGLDPQQAGRLLTAAGITLDNGQRITEAEADTIRSLGVASQDLLGEEATVQLARVAGNAMARVAETIVGAFRLYVEIPRRASGTSEAGFVDEYLEVADTMLPAFVRTLDVLLRRQIVAAAQRMWSTDADQAAVTVSRTVGFCDLVGYTAAAAAMSVAELTSVLLEFDELTSEVVARHNGQVIKTVGDEAMFVTEIAADACRIGSDLVGTFGHAQLPPVRVGLAAGQVVSVLGDLFGPDVNLAARLVDVAEPSTVVVSDRVRRTADPAMQFEQLPEVTLKGFVAPVALYRLRP